MRKILAMFVLIAIAVTGIAIGQNFISGWEPGQPVNLSGLDKSVFEGLGKDKWFMDASGSSLTPSMASFLKDVAADGEPIGNVTPKHAYLGSAWKGNA